MPWREMPRLILTPRAQILAELGLGELHNALGAMPSSAAGAIWFWRVGSSAGVGMPICAATACLPEPGTVSLRSELVHGSGRHGTREED